MNFNDGAELPENLGENTPEPENYFGDQLKLPDDEPGRIRQLGQLACKLPGISHSLRFAHKVSNVWAAGKEDYKDTHNKAVAMASAIGSIALVVEGVAKVPSTFIPLLSAQVLEWTGSPIATSATATGLWGASTLIGTSVYNAAMNHYPKAKAAVGENFPSATKHVTSAFDGGEAVDTTHLSRPRRLGHFVLQHLKNGPIAYTSGGAKLIAAGIQGRDPAERRKLARSIVVDGTLLTGLVSISAAQAVVSLQEKHPHTADFIQNHATSLKFWYGVALAVMAKQWFKNTGKEMIKSKIQTLREGSQPDEVEPIHIEPVPLPETTI
jgi:hypothetical protein